jgi:hypothetical protein
MTPSAHGDVDKHPEDADGHEHERERHEQEQRQQREREQQADRDGDHRITADRVCDVVEVAATRALEACADERERSGCHGQ